MAKQNVFITGATSGIGEACALAFANNGYNIILTGRKENLLQEIKSKLVQIGADVITLKIDVRNQEEIDHALSQLSPEWKNIDVLINNAGLALGLEKEHLGDPNDWEIMIDTNIKGVLNVTRSIVPGMVKRNKGHIINIGSIAGDAAYPKGNVYCATKAALKLLTDGLRIDLVDTPLRVTNIKPGLVETHFSITRFHGDKDKADQVYEGIQPLTAKDIADTIIYAVNAPAHVQIAEVLILPTCQATGSIVHRP